MNHFAEIPTIEALLARCLTDPEFLEKAAGNPGRILQRIPADVRVEAEGLDFQKLHRFSGFIGKVQHNYLWEYFPVTRTLMALRGIEHAVFGEYRKLQMDPIHAAADRQARVRKFADFFERYLTKHRDSVARAVFTHERASWELRESVATSGITEKELDSGSLSWRDFLRAAPRIRANVRIAAFSHDPMEAVAGVLNAARSAELRLRRKKLLLVYRLDETGQLRISELDTLSGLVLTAAGGVNSVRQLIANVRQAGLQEVRPHAFRDLLEGAIRAGILRLEARECA